MTDFFTLINATNTSVQGQYEVITTAGGIDPTSLLLAPAIVLLITYVGLWWYSGRHVDPLLTFFLLAEAGLMFGDPFITSVKLEMGSLSLTLATVLFTAAIYHMATMFAELDHARKNSEE